MCDGDPISPAAAKSRDKPWFGGREFVIIGHRGVAAHAPENTLRGAERALEMGVDAIEVDVRKCRDGFVLMHDSTVDRTTNGHGRVSSMSLSELRALDAGNGERVPRVDEFLEVIPPPTVANLELKVAEAAACLEGLKFDTRRLLVSSFHRAALASASRYETGARLALAIDRWSPETLVDFDQVELHFICMDHRAVTSRIVTQVRGAGLELLAYTVNSASRARQLREMEVLGVFTDDPVSVSHRACTLI